MKKVIFLVVFILALPYAAFAGPIPGVEGPVINFLDGKLVVSLMLTKVEMQGGLELKIPRSANSYAGLEPNVLDGGTIFNLKLDVEDIRKALNISVGDDTNLPCGRHIPGIPGGILKDSIRVDLPEDHYNLSFYFHKKLFGTYVPFNFDFPGGSGSIKLTWKGKDIGTLVLVGKEGDKKAAGLIFLQWPKIRNNPEFMKALESSL